jgi:competence protein ComEA
MGERVLEFVKKNVLFVALVFFGIILLSIGFIQYLASNSKTDEVTFQSSAKSKDTTTDIKGASISTSKISVDVEGKVLKPGVYSLPEGARVQDALIASGGMSAKADREYMSKHVNLAQKLSDGAKIYIPGIGEITSADTSVVSNTAPNMASTTSIGDNSNLININTATTDQLDTLPKIGPVTAQKIIASRPYGSKEELVSKKVLGQKTYEGLKDKITAE